MAPGLNYLYAGHNSRPTPRAITTLHKHVYRGLLSRLELALDAWKELPAVFCNDGVVAEFTGRATAGTKCPDLRHDSELLCQKS